MQVNNIFWNISNFLPQKPTLGDFKRYLAIETSLNKV